MSNIQNDAKKVVTDTKAAVTNERRHLVARLMLWLRGHVHTVLVISSGAVILAFTVGLIGG